MKNPKNTTAPILSKNRGSSKPKKNKKNDNVKLDNNLLKQFYDLYNTAAAMLVAAQVYENTMKQMVAINKKIKVVINRYNDETIKIDTNNKVIKK
jgi:hypothetical protein